MAGPILNEVGAIFVPVSDIAAARDWYCGLLGLEPPEILFGHICVLPMREGSGLVLDSRDFRGPHRSKPLFHFNSRDIAAAHTYLTEKAVTGVGPLTGEPFFTFEDPDGNLLMVADVPPAPRS